MNFQSILYFFRDRGRIFVPLMTTLIIYLPLTWIVSSYLPKFRLGHLYFIDFLINLWAAYILYSFSRYIWALFLKQLLIMGFFYIGHVIKIRFFGWPLSPDDVYSFKALVQVLHGWHLALLLAVLIGTAVLFIVDFKFQGRRSLTAAGSLVVLILVMNLFPVGLCGMMDSAFDNSLWDQKGNLIKRGGALYLISETVRTLANTSGVPCEKDISRCMKEIRHKKFIPGEKLDFQRRSIYMLVMESLWDITMLSNVSFSQDPFYPSFRRLLEESGNSTVLGPCFAGSTANVEYEALTGHPANIFSRKMLFTSFVRNDLPALPGFLKLYGYRTRAFHGNVPSFWNRINVYRRMGFDRFYSKNDFEMKDKDSYYLSDESFFKQAWKMVEADKGDEPRFYYLLSLTGHWPYHRNRTRRPDIIETDSDVKEVTDFANSTWYITRAMMGFVSNVIRTDSNALIVIFGDHLPNLGNDTGGYVRHGLLAEEKGLYTAEMYRIYSSTPLVVYDGTNGAAAMGHFPTYELPCRLLKLLNNKRETHFDYALPKPGFHFRVFPGYALGIDDLGNTWIAKENISKYYTCWLNNVRALDKDLLFGGQYSIK